MSARCELIAGRSFAKLRRDPAIFARSRRPLQTNRRRTL